MQAKIQRIKWLVLDVDGVLTDGRIIVDSQGKEIKFFDVQDGFGIVFFQRLGYNVAIITARSSPPVDFRAKDLGIEKVYQNAFPKIKAYQQLLSEQGIADEEVCFIGDDLPDLQVMGRVGFKVAVSNAVDELKAVADYVTRKEGGRGAIREVIELILKGQNRWHEFLKSMNT